MKELSLQIPPNLAVALDATTPAPSGGTGSIIWSTTTSCHLRWDGTAWRSLIAQNLQNRDLVGVRVISFTEVNDGNSGTAFTVDWSAGLNHKLTLTGNCTLTFTSPGATAKIVLKLIQDATGGRTVTWPGSVLWMAGTAPALSTTANAVDFIAFYFDGTNYWGAPTTSDGALKNVKTITFGSEVDDGNSATADTIDWRAGQAHKSTLTGNCTYTFTAPPGVGWFSLRMIQDATGGRTVTWPGSVTWLNCTAPVLSTAAGAVDAARFFWDGTTYWGLFYRADQSLRNVKAMFYSAFFDNGNSGTAKTIDLNAGNLQKLTLTGNCTITLTPPTSGFGSIRLTLLQDATGSRTVTWPGTVKWAGGAAPTLSTAASARDKVVLDWDGTQYDAQFAKGFA